MTTKPVNNGGMPNPLLAPKGAEVSKAKDAAVGLPAAGGAGLSAKSDAKASNVKISETAKGRADAMQRAFDIAKSTPDVNESRVA